MLERGSQIAMKKGAHFFSMVTVGRSRAKCLPAKHEAICEIPQRGKLNLIPTAQPPNKEIHRPSSKVKSSLSQMVFAPSKN